MKGIAPEEAKPTVGAVVGVGRTAIVYEWGSDAVVKLFRAGMPSRAAESEAAIAAVVSGLGAPAPQFLGVIEIEGRTGVLYQRLRGPSMPDRSLRRPWSLDSLARTLARVHVRMHEMEGSGLPRVLDRLAQAIERVPDFLPDRAREAALERLSRLPDGPSLCHGDLHPYNVLLTSNGPIVIDWTNAGVGSAGADVVRTEYLLLEAVDPNANPLFRLAVAWLRRRLRSVYMREYLRLHPIPAPELRAWRLPILAARLAEGIDEERSRLLSLIDLELGQS